MREFEIEAAKRRLTGMVLVRFREGLRYHVGISDIVTLANNRVRVATKRCHQREIVSITSDPEIYAKKVK